MLKTGESKMNQEKCKNCRYWGENRNAGSGAELLASTVLIRFCRLGGPTKNAEGYGTWPATTKDDWCGKYELVRTS